MNQRKRDIYNYKERLEGTIKEIQQSNLSQNNKDTLMKYHESVLGEGLSNGRILKHLSTLAKITSWIDKDLDKATKEDLEKIQIMLRTNAIKPSSDIIGEYSSWTKHDYIMVIKRFYKWLNNNEPNPICKGLKPTSFLNRDHHRYVEADFVTEDEFHKLRKATDNPRDLCMIDIYEESGMRPSEGANIRIKDLQTDDYGIKLMVVGKTGERPLRLVKSAPSIAKWLSCHPLRDNPDSPLFTELKAKKGCKSLDRQGIQHRTIIKVFKKLFDRAEIKKPFNPYIFRHRRAQLLANAGWSEFELCSWMGWRIGSPVAATYIASSGRRIEDKALEYNGVKKQEQQKIQEPPIMDCPRCNTRNEKDSQFCHKCGTPLSIKVALVAEEYQKKKAEVASTLLEQGVDLSTTDGKLKALKIIEELKAQILL